MKRRSDAASVKRQQEGKGHGKETSAKSIGIGGGDNDSIAFAIEGSRGGAGVARRGWNPLKRQKGEGPRAWSAMEAMLDHSGWHQWVMERRERWRELALEAFEKGPNGKLLGGGRMLASACEGGSTEIARMLLEWGLDANAVENWGDPPLFYASRACAELLLDFGADGERSGRSSGGAWEAWANRRAAGQISQADFEWLEGVCPPPTLSPGRPDNGGNTLSERVFFFHHGEMALRMAELWPDPKTLQIRTSEELKERLGLLAQEGDLDKFVLALTTACGAEAMRAAALDETPVAKGMGAWGPIEYAMRHGRVKTLGVWDRMGVFKEKALGPIALRVAHAASGGREEWMERAAEGLAWAAGRMGKEESALALEAFEALAAGGGSRSMPLARKLATRGWLPASGPGSLTEVFGEGGALWEPEDLKKPISFAEFSALCDKKAVRSSLTMKPSSGGKKSKGSSRL